MSDPVISSPAEFQAFVAGIEAAPGYHRPAAWGIGLARFSIEAAPGSQGARILDTWYPAPNRAENYGAAAVLAQVAGGMTGTHYLTAELLDRALALFAPFRNDGHQHANIAALEALRAALDAPARSPVAIPQAVVVTFIGDLAHKPADAHDVYLRLHLLSQRKVQPHGQNLDGVFGLLNNVVWTDHGPFDPATFDRVRLRLRAAGVEAKVHSVDKFPRMTDYVVPSGVRIADADRVRLGAHLAEGTTVMHEGFCNFNAGTLGKSMVEGRISAGVVVDEGSDIGGGASIMGTLSGGGKEVIRIGKRCLLGANSGLGIRLGDDCTVEAGLYLTASTKVRIEGQVVKAAQLSGQNGLLFRRNSVTGAVEAVPKTGAGWGGLNDLLHG